MTQKVDQNETAIIIFDSSSKWIKKKGKKYANYFMRTCELIRVCTTLGDVVWFFSLCIME